MHQSCVCLLCDGRIETNFQLDQLRVNKENNRDRNQDIGYRMNNIYCLKCIYQPKNNIIKII